MKKEFRRIFVVIQPLQYLQSLELKNAEDQNLLIVLGANANSQLHNLINNEDWSEIIWLSYNGSFLDLIKNRTKIRIMMKSLGIIDEIIVSSYYNEFMNMVVNYFPSKQTFLLEDGVANLFIDSSLRYKSFKFLIKLYCCNFFGFNVEPMNKVKLFTIFKPNSGKIPKIAAEVIVNEYTKLRAKLCSFATNDEIYFINSSYTSCGMISKENYMEFLCKLACEYSEQTVNIILHRSDILVDFKQLTTLNNVNVIASTGPIELYFINNKINPQTVITAGSGATETLKLIYGINIDIILPQLCHFNKKSQKEMDTLVLHFKELHTVRFI